MDRTKVYKELNIAPNIAIIVGAGSGKRMGNKDKIFLTLGGKPVLAHSISPFEKSDSINEIIVVVQKDKINSVKRIINKYKFKKIKKIVIGGKERQDSVCSVLKEVNGANYVLIHDAARPLVTKKLIEDVLMAAKKIGAAIPVVPLNDTVKRGNGLVERTLARNGLWCAQTP